MRILIGGLQHETNAYVASPTELSHFTVTRGQEIFVRHAGRTYLGGMALACGELGYDAVGTFHAVAQPSGTITAAAYTALRAELLDHLSAALPADAVLLDLHGAGVAEGIDDIEGDLCVAVRDLVGPHIPLVVTHDLHGNITQVEAETVDMLFGVHHYPHDDMFDRGREAVHAVPRLISREWRPVIRVERLPLLMPTTTTYEGPGRRIYEMCQEMETRTGVLDCTFFHGFPYADNPNVRSVVIVTTDDNAALAQSVAQQVAKQVWALRSELLARHPQPSEAVAMALASEGQPIVINETSDNPGGGAPCDGTHLLRALLDAHPERAVFVGIKDPAVVELAIRAGVNATIDVDLGGKTDPLHGTPIRCAAIVRKLTDGNTIIEAPMARGFAYPLGPTALLDVNGVEVIVISAGMQTLDRTPLLLHGIDPADRKVVALKSSHHFRSGYQDLAARIITTDPPGLTTLDMSQLPRSRTPRPVFPLDADAGYPSVRTAPG